jgi:adenine specific DNA methylase Mod
VADNRLYYGDTLDVLRRHITSESVDLVYLDPPFNSSRSYNVLFKEVSGASSDAQIEAFDDTWHWGPSAAAAYEQVIRGSHQQVAGLLRAMVEALGHNDVTAYLTMMAVRLVELHRVLTPTGSIYLHCDPTASHYLKALMDAVFGPRRFLNEVSWKRSSAHSDNKQGMRRYGRIHDVLLVYTKTERHTWNDQYMRYRDTYLQSEYRHVDSEGRGYKETDLTAAKPGGDTEYEWRVKRAAGSGNRWQPDLEEEYARPDQGFEYRAVRPYKGRYWAYSKANLIDFAKRHMLIHRETGMPRLVQLTQEMPGVPLQDFWDDITPASGREYLGYPTQKPLALLERVVEASSNTRDVVLDPFCGCGTALHAAQKLGRRWVGIDITHLAIGLIRRRMQDAAFDTVIRPTSIG